MYSTNNDLDASVSSVTDEVSPFSTAQTIEHIEPSTLISQTTLKDEQITTTETTTSIPASERITGSFDFDKSTTVATKENGE